MWYFGVIAVDGLRGGTGTDHLQADGRVRARKRRFQNGEAVLSTCTKDASRKEDSPVYL